MPPKRRFKHVPPITSAAPPNFSNRSPSPHGQRQQSNPSLFPVSTPSITHSGVDTTSQPSVDPTAQSTPDHEASNGPLRKKIRGLSRGLVTQKIMDRGKQKLMVQAKEGDMRTFGATSSLFANEIGIIMRNVVSQRLTGWSAATPHDKELAHWRLQEKFDVDLNDRQMYEIVERHCRERYKEHRSKCHKKYKELKLEGKDPIQYKPSTVKSQDDWEWMCAHFESEKFLKRSAAATCNRAKIPYNHHGGTRSFTATREALSTQEEAVGPIELFRRMHSTAKGWDNQLAESRYREMEELQQAQLQLEDDASIMDETTICAQVLGRSAGTISGIGPAPRKSYTNTSKTASKLMEQVEILAQKDKEKDIVISELAQKDKDKDIVISELTRRVEQQTLLMESLIARMDTSQNPSTRPTNDLPPPL